MSKALVNALAMALAMEERYTLAEAVGFATEFVAANLDLVNAPPAIVASRAGVRPTGPVPICPNCHEPVNDHMPNCARATGVDPRAVTAVHHLRVDGPPPAE